jgi:hypothetical protein
VFAPPFRLTFALCLGFTVLAGTLLSPAKAGTFVCSSDTGARARCPTEGYSSVKLVKKLSKRPCQKGVGWGVDDDGLWVDKGCVARFAGTLADSAEAPSPAAQGQVATDLICSSVDMQPAHCLADVSHGLQLVQQLSQAPCVQNRSWGADPSGIWVTQGCSGHFAMAGTQPVRTVAVGGAVGAVLGSTRDINTYNTTIAPTTVIQNHYYPQPYPTGWNSKASVDDQNRRLQQQQDEIDRAVQAQQRAAYQANQQRQQDEIDRAQQEQQRAAYEENQRRQQEEAAAQQKAAEEAARQQQIKQGEEEENRAAAEAQRKADEEAQQKAAEEAARQQQIKQGEDEENRMAAEAQQKAAEEAARQQQIKQGEQDELNQAAGAPPDQH